MTNTLGDRIKIAREAEGLSMSELAFRLNVSKQVVWAWEHRDIKNIKLAHTLALRDVLNISIDWLVSGRGEMRDDQAPFRVLTELQKNLLTLFESLPESEQTEHLQTLENKKSYFDAILKELLAKQK